VNRRSAPYAMDRMILFPGKEEYHYKI